MSNNSFRPSEKTNETGPAVPDQNINIPRAFWVAIIFTVVSFSSFMLAIVLSFSLPVWQIYTMGSHLGISSVSDVICIVLIRRGQAGLALRIHILGNSHRAPAQCSYPYQCYPNIDWYHPDNGFCGGFPVISSGLEEVSSIWPNRFCGCHGPDRVDPSGFPL